MNIIRKSRAGKNGFTMIEIMIAMAVLSFGVLSLATIYTQGLQSSAQNQVRFIAQQKAQEALETLFTARDTKLLTWAQIANVSHGGVFLDGPQQLLAPGADGLVGTADDDALHPDVIAFGAGPSNTTNLNPWMTRTIAITPDPTIPNLDDITITVTYTYVGQTRQFVIKSYLSSFS